MHVRRFDLIRQRAFTILEVILIVAIIGMMMMMIVGYLLAPKDNGPLPPVEERKLIPGSNTPAPAPAPAAKPTTPVPAGTPGAAATPTKSIDLTPGSVPAFR